MKIFNVDRAKTAEMRISITKEKGPVGSHSERSTPSEHHVTRYFLFYSRQLRISHTAFLPVRKLDRHNVMAGKRDPHTFAHTLKQVWENYPAKTGVEHFSRRALEIGRC